MARPTKKIDPEQVKQLASFGLSGDEIAAVLGCGRATIYRRFETVIKEGHLNRNSSLVRKQFEVAMTGNPTMLIWLGKQHLNQSDKAEVKDTTPKSLDLGSLAIPAEFNQPRSVNKPN